MDGVQGLIGQNCIVDFIFILTTERRLLKQHLVYQNTKRPPVHSSTISFVHQNLLLLA